MSRGASRSGLTVIVACLVCLAAATALVDPGAMTGDRFIGEIGAWLVIGVLITSVSHGLYSANLLIRAGHGRTVRVSAGLVRTARRGSQRLGMLILLVSPALVAGWELGASTGRLVDLAVGLLTATILGTVLGCLAASTGVEIAVGVPLVIAVSSLILWPATIMWSEHFSRRFPAPELPVSVISIIVTATLFAAIGAVVARSRARRRS